MLRRLSVGILSLLGRRARRSEITNERTIGVREAGHLRDVVPLLDHVEGVTELVAHPGVGVEGYAHWNYDWDGETRALTAAGLRDEITRRGIRLIGPSQVGGRIS